MVFLLTSTDLKRFHSALIAHINEQTRTLPRVVILGLYIPHISRRLPVLNLFQVLASVILYTVCLGSSSQDKGRCPFRTGLRTCARSITDGILRVNCDQRTFTQQICRIMDIFWWYNNVVTAINDFHTFIVMNVLLVKKICSENWNLHMSIDEMLDDVVDLVYCLYFEILLP